MLPFDTPCRPYLCTRFTIRNSRNNRFMVGVLSAPPGVKIPEARVKRTETTTGTLIAMATIMTRILLVEDSDDVLFLIQMELEYMGYAVVTSKDGVSGIKAARLNPPDMIISDIQMPGVDGYEFIRRVR